MSTRPTIIAAAAAPASGVASGTRSRSGIESSQRLGKHRWVVERTFAWINRLRRLAIRNERRLDIHYDLTALACSLICLNALQSRF